MGIGGEGVFCGWLGGLGCGFDQGKGEGYVGYRRFIGGGRGFILSWRSKVFSLRCLYAIYCLLLYVMHYRRRVECHLAGVSHCPFDVYAVHACVEISSTITCEYATGLFQSA